MLAGTNILFNTPYYTTPSVASWGTMGNFQADLASGCKISLRTHGQYMSNAYCFTRRVKSCSFSMPYMDLVSARTVLNGPTMCYNTTLVHSHRSVKAPYLPSHLLGDTQYTYTNHGQLQ